MKCKCKNKCKYRLDIEQDLEKKDNIRFTIWRKGFLNFTNSIIISKKELKDALNVDGEVKYGTQ